MEKILNSKFLKLIGYASFVLIFLEIGNAFIQNQTLSKIVPLYASLILIVLGPIAFIFLLTKSKALIRKKYNFFTGLGIILLFVFASMFVAIALANISLAISPNVPANEITEIAKVNPTFVFFLLVWQLLGEEAIKFAMFFLIYKGVLYEEDKKNKYWISWLIVSVLFGLLHLSTYGYNFLHCILVIGLPTMLYALLWKITARPSYLWLTHIIYDLILVSLALIFI